MKEQSGSKLCFIKGSEIPRIVKSTLLSNSLLRNLAVVV